MTRILVFAGIAVVLRLTTPAQAAMFDATLTGEQEIPRVVTAANGHGSFVLNDAETELTFLVTYAGLTGGLISGVHFHNAPEGEFGDIVRHVAVTDATSPDGSVSGIWRATDPPLSGPDPNRGPLTPALVDELAAGRIYFNIHTNDPALPNFPAGEIRGQLIPIPEPTPAILMVTGLGAVIFARRKRLD